MQLPRTAIIIAGTTLALGLTGTAFAGTGTDVGSAGSATSNAALSMTAPTVAVCANSSNEVNVATGPSVTTVASGSGDFTSSLELNGQSLATMHIVTNATSQTLSALSIGLNAQAGVQASAASTTPASASVTVTDAATNGAFNVNVAVDSSGVPQVSLSPTSSDCTPQSPTLSAGTGSTNSTESVATVGGLSTSASTDTTTTTDASARGDSSSDAAASSGANDQTTLSTSADPISTLPVGSPLHGSVDIASGVTLSLGN